mmetsp:Transcript_10497/g.20964  ORF Transcript_10497/g.20964 Transcript_10497/m.20964 type:complete len:257 (+) Transcript_10497:638-1408(+)
MEDRATAPRKHETRRGAGGGGRGRVHGTSGAGAVHLQFRPGNFSEGSAARSGRTAAPVHARPGHHPDDVHVQSGHPGLPPKTQLATGPVHPRHHGGTGRPPEPAHLQLHHLRLRQKRPVRPGPGDLRADARHRRQPGHRHLQLRPVGVGRQRKVAGRARPAGSDRDGAGGGAGHYHLHVRHAGLREGAADGTTAHVAGGGAGEGAPARRLRLHEPDRRVHQGRAVKAHAGTPGRDAEGGDPAQHGDIRGGDHGLQK